MEQSTIYDFLGIENDPIFNIINNLQKGQEINLGGVSILLNQTGLYEMETEFSHDCFYSKKHVYHGVSKFLSLLDL